MANKYDPFKGKRTLKRLIGQVIRDNGGEMPLEDLLNCLRRQGYNKDVIRSRLRSLDVEVEDGVAKLQFQSKVEDKP